MLSQSYVIRADRPRFPVPDEFEYSVLYSNIFKSVNWVMFPRVLGADKFGANKVVSHGKKSYYVPAEMSHREIAMLFDTRHTLPSEPVFGVVNSFDPERYGVPLREVGCSTQTSS